MLHSSAEQSNEKQSPSFIKTYRTLYSLVYGNIYSTHTWHCTICPQSWERIRGTCRWEKHYENIAQNFSDDKYFSSRPSAVNYNAAGSGGSNKGPSNPDYLATVQARIDTFMMHNPEVRKSDIPSDLVTASGSGEDPNISIQGAFVQIPRIAKSGTFQSVNWKHWCSKIQKNHCLDYLERKK